MSTPDRMEERARKIAEKCSMSKDDMDRIDWKRLISIVREEAIKETLEKVKNAGDKVRNEVLEEAARVAESVECDCKNRYPKGKEQYHGHDCETACCGQIFDGGQTKMTTDKERMEEVIGILGGIGENLRFGNSKMYIEKVAQALAAKDRDLDLCKRGYEILDKRHDEAVDKINEQLVKIAEKDAEIEKSHEYVREHGMKYRWELQAHKDALRVALDAMQKMGMQSGKEDILFKENNHGHARNTRRIQRTINRRGLRAYV